MTSTPTKIPSPAFRFRISQPPHWGKVDKDGEHKTVDKYDHKNVDKDSENKKKENCDNVDKETILLGSASRNTG